MNHLLRILMFLNLSARGIEARKPTSKSFEQEARAAAARMGFPGYPDAYQDTFVAGALWARDHGKTKRACLQNVTEEESED